MASLVTLLYLEKGRAGLARVILTLGLRPAYRLPKFAPGKFVEPRFEEQK